MTNVTNNKVGSAKMPIWFWIVSGLGLLWNAYGLYQFFGSFSATQETLMSTGMTAEQAQIYLGLPDWMSVVFAIGVIGGLIGCVLLLLRKRLATSIFVASLVGYIALFLGDVFYGVFANIPAQLVILAVVVAIAVVLLWFSRHFERRGALS